MYFREIISILICGCFFSCQSSEDKKLENVLSGAKENRVELEQVLQHYKQDPLKEKATRFLILNMQGHGRYDLSATEKLQPMYDKHQEISEKYHWGNSTEWHTEIDSCWKQKQDMYLSKMRSQKPDIQTLKADWLIQEIDLAFKAWQENVYTRDCSFEDFCSYILPYRVQNRICADDSRNQFAQRHARYFSDNTIDFRVAADSLLYQYRELKHFDFAAMSLPILNVATFEQIKRGSCDDRTWFNTQLMSALGMAIATDFVPVWGNRGGGHSWNALIINGETYPFEPFWDDDRWKYKVMYNNQGVDRIWGKFRLPKVFRSTYKYSLEGPLSNFDIVRADIPDFFLNPWIKDVSDQYFQTTDVQIQLTKENASDEKYCYLCIFDHKRWIPVEWGKIQKNGSVSFEKMGRDIVYLPAFCKNGVMEPAASPFLLHQDGSCEQLVCSSQTTIIADKAKPYLDKKEIAEKKKWLSGARLFGCSDPDKPKELLYEWTDSLDMWNNEVSLPDNRPYQYLRLIPATDSIAFCDLSFIQSEDMPVIGVHASAEGLIAVDPDKSINNLVDSFSATGFRGVFKDYSCASKGILFDLNREYKLKKLSFVPYTDSDLEEGMEVELIYWDNAWISVEKKIATGRPLTFENVPSGTIYRIKRPYVAEQIFIYREGLIEWR